jgi:hypothetical protein
MKKIYVVTSGSYSDYRIEAVFSTEEKAEDFIKHVEVDELNGIEEYDLNPKTASLVKNGYFMWDVCILKDGTVERVNKTESCFKEKTIILHRNRFNSFNDYVTLTFLQVFTWAKTEKHAVKIANEKRIQFIERGEFV